MDRRSCAIEMLIRHWVYMEEKKIREHVMALHKEKEAHGHEQHKEVTAPKAA